MMLKEMPFEVSDTGPDPMIGQFIGHYEILEKLGGGGMGVVYKARDVKLDRCVALKFLPPRLSEDAEARRRFVIEARAASALDHPNISTIHEMSETPEGRFFIVMSYCEGDSLQVKMACGLLPLKTVLQVAIQITRGLDAAHRGGIIHRDIKPANIMVSPEGHVRIVDFGLAKMADANLTRSGAVQGTALYMSPEQVRGDRVDHRTDLWSLGVLLYEMITDEHPFRGEYQPALFYAVLHADPSPVRALRPDVPKPLEDLVLKLLVKDPAGRHADAEEVLLELEALEKQLNAVAARGPVEKRMPTLAVLPFVDMSPEQDQEYFCDGMAEEIINVLTRIRYLHVVARTSAFAFKADGTDIREIGRGLGADALLKGSLRKVGDRLRIGAQLISVADGFHLWSDRFDRTLEDVFAIQDEIAQAVARAIEDRLTRQERVAPYRNRAADPEAYELYLWGRHLLNKKTPESIERSIAYLRKVIAKDPDYAPAYAGEATAYFMSRMFGALPQKQAISRARLAAAKALELDESLPEAWIAMGLVHEFSDFDWRAAEGAFCRAVELNPGGSEAHLEYGLFLARMGRYAEALPEAERALALDPLSPFAHYGVAEVYFTSGHYDRAIDQANQAVELEPGFVLAYVVLGWAHLQEKRYEEALCAFERISVLLGTSIFHLSYAGYLFAVTGRRQEALRVLDTLKEQLKLEEGLETDIALVYTGLEEWGEALSWLERAYKHRSSWLPFIHRHPSFAVLDAEPRFQALRARMGLA